MSANRVPSIGGAVACLLLCFLTAAAFLRNALWLDGIALWQDVIQKTPANSRAYGHLGVEFHKRSDYARALEYYRRAINADPYLSINSYRNLAQLYVDTKEYDKAVRIITLALSIDQNDYELFTVRGGAYLHRKDFREAIEDYSRAVMLNPGNSVVYMNRAAAFAAAGHHEQAKQDYQEACRLGHDGACDKLKETKGGISGR